MERVLMYSIVLAFGILLFVNIYFRIKVIKQLKVLRSNQVPFESDMIFNKEKLQTLLRQSPPETREAILQFSQNMRHSMNLAIALLALITLFGGVLMYYRKNG
jgi:hypothetical protein